MAEPRSSNPVWNQVAVRDVGGQRVRTGDVPSDTDLGLIVHGTGDRLTVTDVIVHTAGLFAILGVGALVGWLSTEAGNIGLAMSAGFVAFGISMVIGFALKRVPLVIAFAAIEGVFIGGISRAYEFRYSGIVAQALLGTAVVFLVMLGLYRSGRVRATPRMYKVVFAGMMGVIGVSLIDLLLRATGSGTVPILNDSSPLGIIASLAIIGLAAFMLTLDFDQIDRAVAAGAPRQAAWALSYGLLVSFVWVYLEMLRLLSKLRD
jgi:uncharacterized YccA/Bax inhibitor family protein